MTTSGSEQGLTSCAWTLADVLPQKPPMVLLDGIVSHSAKATSCCVRIEASSPFAALDGSMPSWIALEFMAQCAAAHSGICERDKGNPIRLGFLLGSRRITLHVPSFRPAQDLLVSARTAWDDGELASFECDIRDAKDNALLVECELSAYSPHNIQDLLARQNT